VIDDTEFNKERKWSPKNVALEDQPTSKLTNSLIRGFYEQSRENPVIGWMTDIGIIKAICEIGIVNSMHLIMRP